MGSLMLNSSKYGLFELIIADVDNYGLMGKAYGPSDEDYTPQVVILPRGGVDVISQLDRLVRSTKPDTVYLPQAVIDSAFGWKYGNPVDKSQVVANFIKGNIEEMKRLDRICFPEHTCDIGNGWKITTYESGVVGIDYNDKCVGSFNGGVGQGGVSKVLKDIESGIVRFILYTDKDGHNCLAVKSSAEDMAIYYAGVPGFGVIMTRGGLTIENIGFLPVEFSDGVSGLLVIADIKNDGKVGVFVVKNPKDPHYSDEYRIASAVQ
jgi:hypothetical protein